VKFALAAAIALGLAAPARDFHRHASLADATGGQDARFHAVFDAVNKWIAEGAFPGAVLAVGQHGSLLALKAFGCTEYSPDAPAMRVDEIFDLASVSKVIGTTSAAAILYQRKKLKLDEPVVHYVPEFAGPPDHDRVTIRELLTHSSGIPTPGRMYEKATDKSGILKQIYSVPLASPPGTRFVYRDPNFILLGDIIERVSGRPLGEFLAALVFAPLGMTGTGYNPPPALAGRIAPTEMDNILRHHIVRGEVHDENCYTMGGVCGHAGLFSTAGDLAIYAQMLLNGGTWHRRRIFRKSTVRLFIHRQDLPPGSSRALGWDAPETRVIYHTGFTGTSVYIDFARDAFIILLTNRVYPTRNNDRINQARPEIHSEILRALPSRR
jgi:serine-type D-Ala-D-Ala carboxypeptidase